MARTPQQLLEQATRHAAHLERLKTQDVNELIELLDEVNSQVMARLQRGNITDFSRSRLEAELATINQLMTQSMDESIVPTLNRQLVELGQYEAQFEIRSLENVTVNAEYTMPADTQIREAIYGQPLQARGANNGKLLEPFIKDWETGAVERVSQTVRAGYVQGLTTQEIVRSVRETAMVPSTQNLQAIARTALQHSANEARMATWNANRDIVKRYRWVSTLDARTTSQCQALDGQTWVMGEGPVPPAHINCRSTTAAVLDERFDFLEEDGTRFARDPETGRARVGEVPANETYYGWLKRQPAEVQDSIIGPQRGALLRNGGITTERFRELQLDRNFEPLTLDEMRELEPAAFKRAGLDDSNQR